MIKVNLLPPSARRAGGAAFSVEDLPWKKIGIGAAGAVVLISVLLAAGNAVQGGALGRLRAEMAVLAPQGTRLEQVEAALRDLQSRSAAMATLRAPERQWAPRLNLFTDSLVADLWFTHLLLLGSASSETEEFLRKEFQELGLPDFNLPPLLRPEPQPGMPPAVGPDGLPVASGIPSRRFLILSGAALVSSRGAEAPVTRFLQRLREHPEFARWFEELELKDVAHSQVGQEEVSNFAVLLYPTGSS